MFCWITASCSWNHQSTWCDLINFLLLCFLWLKLLCKAISKIHLCKIELYKYTWNGNWTPHICNKDFLGCFADRRNTAAIFSHMYFGSDTGGNDWVSESSKTTTTTEFFTSWTKREAQVYVWVFTLFLYFLFCFSCSDALYIFIHRWSWLKVINMEIKTCLCMFSFPVYMESFHFSANTHTAENQGHVTQ